MSRHRLGSWTGLVAAAGLLLSPGMAVVQAQSSPEAPHTALDSWLTGLKSLRAEFTQTVKDGQGHQTDQTRGELLVLRPGRFAGNHTRCLRRSPAAAPRPSRGRC